MRDEKKKRLQAKGWKIGDARDLLRLTPAEQVYVELRLALGDGLRRLRSRRALTQTDVAKVVGSSQSRVAKMEAGDAAVSVDLLMRSLIALGASRRDLARLVAGTRSRETQ
jgi:DNA-binding XRE family transcriptional regulator